MICLSPRRPTSASYLSNQGLSPLSFSSAQRGGERNPRPNRRAALLSNQTVTIYENIVHHKRVNMLCYEEVSPVCVLVCHGIPRFVAAAHSWLRNAEWRTRRVSTPLPLPQPETGMYREQVETPSHPGRLDGPAAPSHAPQPPPSSTHSALPRSNERKSITEQHCCENASQRCYRYCGHSFRYDECPTSPDLLSRQN